MPGLIFMQLLGDDREVRFSEGGSAMSFFALFSALRSVRSSKRQPKATTTFAPRRLERRRVLDAAAAELLMGPLGGETEFVQTTQETSQPTNAPAQSNSVDPGKLVLKLNDDKISENDLLVLEVRFDDSRVIDAHIATIDWGDDTPLETVALVPGETSFTASHRYIDDDPTVTRFDSSEIEVSLFYLGGKQLTATTTLNVDNVSPTIDTLSFTSPIEEFQFATLNGTFSDPGTRDTFELDIDWDGDHIFDQTVSVSGGEFQVTRQFLDDDPTGTARDTYDVNVRLRDDDSGFAEASTSLTVENVAPSTPLLFTLDNPAEESGLVQVLVVFNDPGILDSHTVGVRWGDGTATETFDVPVVGQRIFLLSHVYADDNPTGTPSDTYHIEVTVTDDDGGQSTAGLPILVENVNPVLTVAADQVVDEGALLDLTGGGLGAFVDVGLRDTHTATVNWGDGTATEAAIVSQGEGVGTLSGSHHYADNGQYTVTVILSDDDGGTDTQTFQVTVNNVAPDLVVVGDQMVDEGSVLSITDLGMFSDPGYDNPLNNFDPALGGETEERFFFKIDWGDATLTNVVPATIDQPGGPGVATTGSFDGSHVYADDGLYTVTVQLFDDDGGVDVETFQVLVKNVDPSLAGIDPMPTVNEGTAFTLADLGVTLTDPGFDNQFNPLQIGGSQETFTALTVDWGDGTPAGTLNVVNRISGDPGVLTTAEFEHAPHTYADNGLYTVTLTVGDDDGGLVQRTFQIEVHNVAPTLVLTDRMLEISESETLDLFDLGSFTDPGFDNPLNVGDPSNGGEVTETFSYTIDWGDGNFETGQLPATLVSGTVGVDSFGTLVDSHQYLDNDADNLYTITVTLSDDDGGSVAEQLQVRVLNVNPSLEPVTATDLNTGGETYLTLEFADPGTEVLTVWVDWGDQLALPPEMRFVPETFVLGPGTQNVTLMHTYTGPPNPLNPSADIVISVFVRDDDFGMPLVVEPGQSVTQMVAITNPGEGVNPVRIDTTPQVPRLIFPRSEEVVFLNDASTTGGSGSTTADLRTAVGDTKSIADRYLELRVIDPATGEESEGYRLKSEVLNDLPGLFKSLPDNHYAIYLVRTETNSRRLVIEVYVRNGKLIDPGDDSEGTRDRPPTDEATQEPKQAPAVEETSQVNEEQVWLATEKLETVIQSESETSTIMRATSLGLGIAGLAATRSSQAWWKRIDRAVANADSRKWKSLRRRNPYKRK